MNDQGRRRGEGTFAVFLLGLIAGALARDVYWQQPGPGLLVLNVLLIGALFFVALHVGEGSK